MSISRRGFFISSATAAAVASFPHTMVAGDITCEAKPGAVQKLSCPPDTVPGNDLPKQLALIEKWGFDGVELGGYVVGNEKRFEDALKNTKLQMSAVCWGSCGGALVSEVAAKRASGVAQLKEVLTSAGALKATGVVYVPAFNDQTKLGNEEIRKLLVESILPEVGEHAVKMGTRVIMEPLNRKEAFFLRQVADAASIVRDCKSPGVAVMGDFYHMYYEETSDLGAFISGGSLVHHVHMASAHERVLPGQDERSFVDGFRGLKWIGYQDFCSLECGIKGDYQVEIPKCVAFLRDQWAQA